MTDDLPRRTSASLEIAVAGRNTPTVALAEHGWRVRDSHALTSTHDRFLDYIASSCGECSVCKNIFVGTNRGFSANALPPIWRAAARS